MYEEICEAVQEEESHAEILEPPTMTIIKLKPDTILNCLNTCLTWAEENGVSAKEVILRNIQNKILNKDFNLHRSQKTCRTHEHYIPFMKWFILFIMNISIQSNNPAPSHF